MTRLCAALAALLSLAACGVRAEQRPMVYAAASLRESLVEAVALHARHTGVEARLNFAASNLLAEQILAARAADLFLSADAQQMERVADAGLVAERCTLLSNGLVVVEPLTAPARVAQPADLCTLERVSLANPEAVPAGRYARAWLAGLDLWACVAERVVPAIDVRAALAVVESGAAPAGIVYATDAAMSRRVRVALAVPPEAGPPIAYSLALLHDAAPDAAALYSFLKGSEAGAVFARHGFLPPP